MGGVLSFICMDCEICPYIAIYVLGVQCFKCNMYSIVSSSSVVQK